MDGLALSAPHKLWPQHHGSGAVWWMVLEASPCRFFIYTLMWRYSFLLFRSDSCFLFVTPMCELVVQTSYAHASRTVVVLCMACGDDMCIYFLVLFATLPLCFHCCI